MKKRTIIALLTTVLLCGMLVGLTLSVSAAESVSYIDISEQSGALRKETKSVSDYTLITAATTELTDGYYVVSGEVILTARLQVKGTAHLILKDGAHLKATYGIGISLATYDDEYRLYIYAQSESADTMGRLTATADSHDAGIGTDYQKRWMGDIVINGGNISATGGTDGAGIGHGFVDSVLYGSITINGGIVNAVGGANSAGIGASRKTAIRDILIQGGTVTAEGAVGIGSLFHDAEISITGGTVTATGISGGAGIGCGKDSSGGSVTITGGKVVATGAEDAAGIGVAGDGKVNLIYITATDVTATGGAGADDIGSGQNGVIFSSLLRNGDNIDIHGEMTLPSNFVVEEGERLLIVEDATLVVPNGITLLNNGTVQNSGVLQIDGEMQNNGKVQNDGVLRINGTLINDGEFECIGSHTYRNCRCFCGYTKHQRSVSCNNGFCPNGCYEPAKKVSSFYYSYLCETHEGYYIIENAGMLFWFAQLVNGVLADGTPQNTAANAILVRTLDLEGRAWYAIGLNHDPAVAGGAPVVAQYTGHFDGNGATVSNFVASGNGAQGLFGYCSDAARIDNFGVIGATVRGWNVGAITGFGAQLTNCFARNCVITGVSDSGTGVATISALGANGSQDAQIKNCYAYNCTLLVEVGEEEYVIHPVAGAVSPTTVGQVQNTYYGSIVASFAYTSVAGATELTVEQMRSGEAAYLLNGSQNAGVWKQELGDEEFPHLISGGSNYDNVYCGYLTCDERESAIYTNDKTIATQRPAHIDENHDHICDNECGANEVGEHSDSANDADHVCDHGCGVVLESCLDKNTDHACDVCRVEMNIDLHADMASDNDHLCDYGCGAVLNSCLDENTDHACDVCGAKINTDLHADAADDNDHLCDYGCGEVLSECADADENHICDECGAEILKKGLPGGAIAGIAVGSATAVGLGGFSLFWFVIKKKKWSDLIGVFKKKS